MAAGPNGGRAIVTERHVVRQRGSAWTEQSGPSGAAIKTASVALGADGAAVVHALTDSAWNGGHLTGGVFVL